MQALLKKNHAGYIFTFLCYTAWISRRDKCQSPWKIPLILRIELLCTYSKLIPAVDIPVTMWMNTSKISLACNAE
jgi:hypothetical protein